MATIDVVTYINTQLTWTTAKKTAMLTDFCLASGYQETVPDENGLPVPNPITKKQFMNNAILSFIKSTVNQYRERKAKEVITYDVLDGDLV